MRRIVLLLSAVLAVVFYLHQPVDIATGQKAQPAQPKVREIKGLIEVTQLDKSFVIDLRYATTKNFTGKRIYTHAKCLLNRHTAEKLVAANAEFRRKGYRLKIWDAYRPKSAQLVLWKRAPNRRYVANPKKGSIHSRGAAVDVTLVDARGRELPMPTGFDDFSRRAHINYTGASAAARKNRELLASIMVRHGFRRLPHEWWHFADANAKRYPLLDVPFSAFAITK